MAAPQNVARTAAARLPWGFDQEDETQTLALARLVEPLHLSREHPPFDVALNVYDVTDQNKFLHPLGMGVYHTGIQVAGEEFCFGYHDFNYTGVYRLPAPRQVPPAYMYRESIALGQTDLSPMQIADVLVAVAVEYSGDSYHLLERNCNHFTNHLCNILCGQPIPSWINRAAAFALMFPCVVPAVITRFDANPESNVGINSGNVASLISCTQSLG